MGDVGETQALAEGASNGASSSTDANRAAFIALAGEKDAPAKDAAKPAAKEIADDDSDLEDDADDAGAELAAADGADDDLDSDLEDEDEDKAVDGDAAKRIEQVKRTDKRMRERREADFKARESAIQKTIDEWAPRIEKAEALEKKHEALIARLRNPYELGDALAELGMSEDDFEPASQTVFARSKKFATDPKFAADPRARETLARMKELRELREETRANREWREKQEAEKTDAAKNAAAEQRITAFITSTTKATTEKTPLAAALIEKNPARAQAEIAQITGRLMDELGAMPTPKQVIVALEKSRRQDLRDLGVDPKTITTVAAAKKQTSAPTDDKTKQVSKKAAPAVIAKDDKKPTKPLTKEDYIAGRYD